MSTDLNIHPPSRHLGGTNRLWQIDALRGVAALLVLVYHTSASLSSFAIRYGNNPVLDQFARDVDFGRMGVMIFFIISGFVVANTLDAPNAALQRFAVRRFFRLYPLYWFSIILAVFLLKGKNYLVKPSIEIPTTLANITMMPTILGFDSIMTLYWTLETELVFYVVAAIIYKLGYLFQPKALLTIIFILVGIFAAMLFGVIPSPGLMSWKSLPLNLAFMFWGVAFYTAFSKRTLALGRPYRKYLLALSAALILSPSSYTLIRYFSTNSPDDFRWAISYPAALFIFLFVFHTKGKFVRLFSSLGLISYSMYLLHPTAIYIFALALDKLPLNKTIASLFVLTSVSIGFTILLSAAAYLFIEKPFIVLGRKLSPAHSPAF